MPSAIVTTTYRYKRPLRKKKRVVLTSYGLSLSGTYRQVGSMLAGF